MYDVFFFCNDDNSTCGYINGDTLDGWNRCACALGGQKNEKIKRMVWQITNQKINSISDQYSFK
jgi:hypothetical protein